MAGRKKLLNDGERKIPLCISIRQRVVDRIKNVAQDKSPLLSGILEMIPDSWLTDYNRDPESFLLRLKTSDLALAKKT